MLNLDLANHDEVLNIRGTTAITNVFGHAGDERYYISNLADENQASALVTDLLEGDLDDVRGELNLHAGTGNNLLMISDEASVTPDTNVVITDHPLVDNSGVLPSPFMPGGEIQIRGLAPAHIHYQASATGNFALPPVGGVLGGITMWMGYGADTVFIDGTHHRAGLRTSTTLNTGLGDDTVTVNLDISPATDAAEPDSGDGFFVLNTQGPYDPFLTYPDRDVVVASNSTLPLIIFGGQDRDDITGGQSGDVIFGDRGRVLYFADPAAVVDLDMTLAQLEAMAVAVLGHGGPGDRSDGVIRHITYSLTVHETVGGNDVIRGSVVPNATLDDEDIIFGGGNDDAAGDPSRETINGAENEDIVMGDYGRIVWSRGLPVLIESTDVEMGGDDVIQGDADDDIIVAGVGNDRVDGDSDRASLNSGRDVVAGDNALILLYDPQAAGAPPIPAGSSHTMRLYFFKTIAHTIGGRDRIAGGPDEDILVGGAAGDFVDGDTGRDLVIGDNVMLSREGRYGDFTGPRFRTLAGTLLYSLQGLSLVTATHRLNPAGMPVWSDHAITLLDHSFAIEELAGNDFGDDLLAGGAQDDMIFGQLGDDIIQGDGDLLVEDDLASRSPDVDAWRDPATEFLVVLPSFEAASDGDDYIEGNGGADVVFGNLGQDDILGGSSDLFGLTDRLMRPDGSDLLFGGAGTDLARNDNGDTSAQGHARDADVVLGDNGRVLRLVGTGGVYGGAFLTFNYDTYTNALPIGQRLRIIPRAADLLDYTPGGLDFNAAAATLDIGAADEIHGESGDDALYGMVGSDVLFGEGQDDDLIGGYGHDWATGGTGQDGLLGDDGRIWTTRNGLTEPLYGLAVATVQQDITTPGRHQQATIHVTGTLKKAVNIEPFNVDPLDQPYFDPIQTPSDDILFGGLGDDWLHGGVGDDALSGAEALAEAYIQAYSASGVLIGVARSDYTRPYNPGNVLRFNPDDIDSARFDRTRRAGEFALYDEYEPRRLILLTDAGALSKTGVGKAFLLNFSNAEGVPIGSPTHGTQMSDGYDALFGDLGQDWLVGGTGRDNMFGGYGNDLVNADDLHLTNGGLNDVPDTHPSFEDRVYGGAGRDVMIGNTGGDRLIDWVGEFNSYLVPFAPFGMSTVSRSLQPQLAEYLYALSAADGADPTRAVDTGADPVRNGEPRGELGVVRQQDFDWHDQTGAPSDPQAGNIAGGQRDVLRSASFNDGTMQGFLVDSGVWEVEGAALQVAPVNLGGDAVTVYQIGDALPNYFEIQAAVRVIKPVAGWKANAYILFDYQSPTDFKFAGINVSIDKLQMGHRDASGWHVDVQSNIQAKPDIDYNMLLAVNGLTATLVVNNQAIFTHTFQPRVVDGFTYGLNWGLVGMGTDNARGRYDDIAAKVLPPRVTFAASESFQFGSGPMFGTAATGGWVAASGRYRGTPAAGEEFAASLVTLGVERLGANSALDVSAIFNTTGRAGFTFDRYTEDDFKYVAIDAVTDQVIIGHLTPRGGWKIDAAFSTPIDAGVDYALAVSLRGAQVNVTLNGMTVVSQVFNAALADGRFGLFSRTGEASFDEFVMSTNDRALEGQPLLTGGKTHLYNESLYAAPQGGHSSPVAPMVGERMTSKVQPVISGAQQPGPELSTLSYATTQSVFVLPVRPSKPVRIDVTLRTQPPGASLRTDSPDDWLILSGSIRVP